MGHDWGGPLRKVKKTVDSSKGFGRVVPALPSHRSVHALARLAAEDAGANYMRSFFWLLAYIGFREGELCALTVEDVEQANRLRIHVRRKAIWRTGLQTIVEECAKGYTHHTVVVPRVLERAVLARVEEVLSSGGSILFPSWTTRFHTERVSGYSAPRGLFLRCGNKVGWEVLT